MSTMFKSMMAQKAVVRPVATPSSPTPSSSSTTSTTTTSPTPKASRPRPGLQRRDAFQDPALSPGSDSMFSPGASSSSSSHGMLSPTSASPSSVGGMVGARSPVWSPPPETLSR